MLTICSRPATKDDIKKVPSSFRPSVSTTKPTSKVSTLAPKPLGSSLKAPAQKTATPPLVQPTSAKPKPQEAAPEKPKAEPGPDITALLQVHGCALWLLLV